MSFLSVFTPRRLILITILTAGLGLSVLIEISAIRSNGTAGFPLDDPWIHLQFARNLHDFGSYSYYRNQMTTSGSTSPLYTFVLAGGMFLTRNEFTLSMCLGVLFLLLGGIYIFRLAEKELDGSFALGGAAALLYILEPRMQWAALSGMETTLFILLLLATLYYYRVRKPAVLGVCAGLLLWARPEALMFIAALGLDVLYRTFWQRPAGKGGNAGAQIRDSPHWVRPALLPLLLLAAAYAAFNMVLSGRVFPNTMSAKLAYYASGGAGFPEQVLHFLADGHMALLSLVMAAGIVAVAVRFIRRSANPALVPALWSLMMVLAYWHSLPFLYQHGRYLMPILPFVILLGMDGAQWVAGIVKNAFFKNQVRARAEAFTLALALVVCVQCIAASWSERVDYAGQCAYITARQVRTALWMRDHLPGDAVVATHDIGAIGYYSGRRIADMVGLVSPEMISGIGRLDVLQEFLARQGVTHLAVLRNWFDVSDQNPLFQTDESDPEIMEVFAYDPARTRFASGEDARLEEVATDFLARKEPLPVAQGLERYLRAAPGTARLRSLLGEAYLALGDSGRAGQEFHRALERCPEYGEAEIGLAEIDRMRGEPSEAIQRLQAVIRIAPSLGPAYLRLAQLYEGSLHDTANAIETMRRYQSSVDGETPER